MRKIIATAALPYANGEVHIGHLLEHVQTDIWCRFLRMQGHECYFICADDTHGAPIMIRAREEGITPEQLIAKAHKEHSQDFKDFQIEHSIYSSTNSEANRILSETFYLELKKQGYISTKAIDQLYCTHDKMFLPDRFIKGTCPKCNTPDQNGDACDACGATYSTHEVKNPQCYLCGTTPITQSSEHYFFELNHFKDYLTKWLPQHAQGEVAAKMMEWFKEDLRPWDISRDEPYFGFKIPGTENKYFYVWVDAPMGYISSSKLLLDSLGKNYEDFWKDQPGKTQDTEIYHFIGKDIIYFHTLFWPAFLKGAGFRSPNQVFVHGFLSVNGEKMSKSKGTNLSVRTYLNHLDPTYLRYYYASKLNSKVEDIDLNLEDFVQRVNSDLIGKITNLASRGAQMLSKKMDGKMSSCDEQGLALVHLAQLKAAEIAKHFEDRDYSKALVEIRNIADEANRYFDEKAPWKTLESNPEETKKVLTTTLNLFRIIAIYLGPVLPEYLKLVESLFNEPSFKWSDSQKVLSNHKIADYQHLASRIDPEKIKAIVEDTKKQNELIAQMRAKAKTAPANKTPPPPSTASSEISIDDFMKVDLRIAEIIEAEEIKEADKLLRLKVDLGDGKPRQIIAGIRSAYSAKDLVGRKTVIVANLAPRKMKFGMSEGMVLAAGSGDGGKELYILSPDDGAKPGFRVK